MIKRDELCRDMGFQPMLSDLRTRQPHLLAARGVREDRYAPKISEVARGNSSNDPLHGLEAHVTLTCPVAERALAIPQPVTGHAPGFTLIETMLAVLLMALLATGAAMSFSQPIQKAQTRQAILEIQGADQAARVDAKRLDRAARLTIDRDGRVIRLFEGPTLRSQTTLSGTHIDGLLIGEKLVRNEPASIDFSGSGYSASYAAHIRDTWVIFHGLSGEMTTAPDEKTARSILNPPAQ